MIVKKSKTPRPVEPRTHARRTEPVLIDMLPVKSWTPVQARQRVAQIHATYPTLTLQLVEKIGFYAIYHTV